VDHGYRQYPGRRCGRGVPFCEKSFRSFIGCEECSCCWGLDIVLVHPVIRETFYILKQTMIIEKRREIYILQEGNVAIITLPIP
jgi:hypothetical protein